MNKAFKYQDKELFSNDPIVFSITESLVQEFADKFYGASLTEEKLAEIDHAMLCPDISSILTHNALSLAISSILAVPAVVFKEAKPKAKASSKKAKKTSKGKKSK